MSEVMLSAMSRLRRLMGRRADKAWGDHFMTCIDGSDDSESENEGEGGGKGRGKSGTETPKGDQGPKNVPSESNGGFDPLNYPEVYLDTKGGDEARKNNPDCLSELKQSRKPRKLKP